MISHNTSIKLPYGYVIYYSQRPKNKTTKATNSNYVIFFNFNFRKIINKCSKILFIYFTFKIITRFHIISKVYVTRLNRLLYNFFI